MQAGTDRRVARRALCQKQHRVLAAHLVGSIYLAEELARIRELRLESREHLFANRVAAGADAGTDGGDQILGREPNSSRIRPTPLSTMRLTVPRQPA